MSEPVTKAPIATTPVVVPVIRKEADRKQAMRERMNSTGGAQLKLAVFGTIEGYHLYWCNDDNNAVEELLFDGIFEFVAPDEVNMASRIVQDADVTGKVSKYVGKKADGSPLRAYLLKCRDDLWDARQAIGQEQANAWDSAILAGTVGGVDSRYNPKGAVTALSRHNQ